MQTARRWRCPECHTIIPEPRIKIIFYNEADDYAICPACEKQSDADMWHYIGEGEYSEEDDPVEPLQ